MNRILIPLLLAGFVGAGLHVARADDSNTDRPVATDQQLMKQCMDKEKSENPHATKADRKKICEDKVKSYDAHPSETHTPPDNPG